MSWLAGLWTVTALELRQRVRGVAWYVLLGVFVLLMLGVTLVAGIAFRSGGDLSDGSAIYTVIACFTLLLATLVTPALAGSAINGDREEGTLATTQVTLVGTAQLVLGKFLAAWIATLAFVVAAVPFILYAVAQRGLSAGTFFASLAIVLLEMAVIAAASVGFSGVIRKPVLSIVVSYLLVAAMSVGTLIGFGLLGLAFQTRTTITSTQADWDRMMTDQANGIDPFQSGGQQIPKAEYCTIVSSYTQSTPHFERVWWLLAANPYVVLADATPTRYDERGNPVDVLGYLKLGIRTVQQPELLTSQGYDECDPAGYSAGGSASPSGRETIDGASPSWFVGLGLHLVTGALLLWWAIAANRTPARRLSAGQRIA